MESSPGYGKQQPGTENLASNVDERTPTVKPFACAAYRRKTL
jgi:hypothetical protein